MENNIELTEQPIRTKINHKIAYLISVILHPAFITIYGIALLFVYTDFQYIFASQVERFMYPVIIFSCLIPVSSLFIFKRAGYISDYSLSKKGERFLPLIVTLMSYLGLFFYFYQAGLFSWFLAVLLVPIFLLLIVGVINIYWKISAHMTSMGALIGTVLSVSYNIKGLNPYILFIILIILAGALGVSRLILKRHTPAQVYWGFVIGLVLSYITVFIGGYYPILLILIRSYFH